MYKTIECNKEEVALQPIKVSQSTCQQIRVVSQSVSQPACQQISQSASQSGVSQSVSQQVRQFASNQPEKTVIQSASQSANQPASHHVINHHVSYVSLYQPANTNSPASQLLHYSYRGRFVNCFDSYVKITETNTFHRNFIFHFWKF